MRGIEMKDGEAAADNFAVIPVSRFSRREFFSGR
jgi:hypothetical protein